MKSKDRKFTVDLVHWVHSMQEWPPTHVIRNAIFENNPTYTVRYDAANNTRIVLCENKPKDVEEYGLKWKELE